MPESKSKNPARRLYRAWREIIHLSAAESSLRYGPGMLRITSRDERDRPIITFIGPYGNFDLTLRADGHFRMPMHLWGWGQRSILCNWTFLQFNHDYGAYNWHVAEHSSRYRMSLRNWNDPIAYFPEHVILGRWVHLEPSDQNERWRIVPTEDRGFTYEGVRQPVNKYEQHRLWRIECAEHFERMRAKRYRTEQWQDERQAGTRPPIGTRVPSPDAAKVALIAATFDVDEPACETHPNPNNRGPKEAPQHDHHLA